MKKQPLNEDSRCQMIYPESWPVSIVNNFVQSHGPTFYQWRLDVDENSRAYFEEQPDNTIFFESDRFDTDFMVEGVAISMLLVIQCDRDCAETYCLLGSRIEMVIEQDRIIQLVRAHAREVAEEN
jgi:hypothetical protein